MDAVVTSLHTTLVTRVLGNTFDALATTRATNDIAVSPSQTESILTETIINTIVTTIIPSPTSTSTNPPASASSSLPTSSASKNDTMSKNPHHLPTILVATLLPLLSLALIVILLIYLLRRHSNLNLPPIPLPFLTISKSPAEGETHVWSTYGLVRASSLERSKKRHRLRDLQRDAALQGDVEEDPIAVAIRREEQERRKQEMEEGGKGSKFYASQVRHLVELLGSKEEVRIDVRGQLKKARSWRWGRGMGMSEEELQKSGSGGGV